MSTPIQFALAVGPLAFYFYLLAIWQGGRHPRVVPGFWDSILLALGVGGLVAFGPFGHLVARMLFRRPDLLDWLAMASAMGLAATLLAQRASNRVVVYHIDRETLERVLDVVLGAGPERFLRTLHGFENRESGQTIVFDVSNGFQTAVVDVHGRDAANFARVLTARLRREFRDVAARPSPLSGVLIGLSGLTVLVPLAGFLLSQSQAREALRVLLQRLQGG
jgi:hypothetical protein